MKPRGGKVMTMREAVANLVRPGMSLALGLSLEGLIPFAAAHEIIRQKVDRLTLIGPISNICFDQLIGAGLVQRVIAAWVGNVSTGIGYNFRRAVEEGLPHPLEVINHSNFSISLALEAGARGLPMAVSASPLGSDIAQDNPYFTPITCPFTGNRLLAVRAVRPDLTIVHVQRADPDGNAQCWGALGIARVAAQAGEKVLVTCEELVDTGVIRSDPERTLVPGFRVAAVVEEPWGAHPAPVQGYYDLDNPHFLDYAARTRTSEGFAAWREEWVDGLNGRAEYLLKLGGETRQRLMVKHSAPSPPVEYGW